MNQHYMGVIWVCRHVCEWLCEGHWWAVRWLGVKPATSTVDHKSSTLIIMPQNECRYCW